MHTYFVGNFIKLMDLSFNTLSFIHSFQYISKCCDHFKQLNNSKLLTISMF